MEFEVLKLLKEFGKIQEKLDSPENDEDTSGPITIVDYM